MTVLWEVHLRIPEGGPVAIACKRAGERLTHGVVRMSTPSDALRLLEQLLVGFEAEDELFITARTHDAALSMWTTRSKAAGLYWCAAALAKLWRPAHADRRRTSLRASAPPPARIERAS